MRKGERLDAPEVRLPRGAALHGFVVRVKMRVIVYFESLRLESGSDLGTYEVNSGCFLVSGEGKVLGP